MTKERLESEKNGFVSHPSIRGGLGAPSNTTKLLLEDNSVVQEDTFSSISTSSDDTAHHTGVGSVIKMKAATSPMGISSFLGSAVIIATVTAAYACWYRRRRKDQEHQEQGKKETQLYCVPRSLHDRIVYEAWRQRGWGDEEARAATEVCSEAAFCGVSSHNFIKALDIDDHLGAGLEGGARGTIPGRSWAVHATFDAVQRWDANRCNGFLVAIAAVDAAMALSDTHGVGTVIVDNAFHYLWGAFYVRRAARRGYVCFTTCTGAIPEVVPYGGRVGTMGTNPWTMALPTGSTSVGFDFVFDWATSVMSNGSVKALHRAGKDVPKGAIVDERGNATTNPSQLAAHQCFGGHKGYSLCVFTELLAAYGGAFLPTLRGAGGYTPYWKKKKEVRREEEHPKEQQRNNDHANAACSFFFLVLRPDALGAGAAYANGRTQGENVAAVAADVLGHGNSSSVVSEVSGQPGGQRRRRVGARLPGYGKHLAAERSGRNGGCLLFSAPEVAALRLLAKKSGVDIQRGDFTEAKP